MTTTKKPNASAQAKHFLSLANQFQLGVLPTETPHPRTRQLSQLAESDLPAAIRLLKSVELEALDSAVFAKLAEVDQLHTEIKATLESGGRIFFCGCGATGRLSLTLETLWREEVERLGRTDRKESVFSFMAGGDFALVRSVENFEDYPEYGARQLNDLGFNENDLLISTTEGGETPFVIGATEEAARISKRKPWFFFCNPKDILVKTAERSRKVIENPKIVSVSLETGPMAVAGSTRLQATTVLMLAAGSALFSALDPAMTPRQRIEDFRAHLEKAEYEKLADLIRDEANIYACGSVCVHCVSDYAITVLTDTTERAPTFSLVPFENIRDPKPPHAWTYLIEPEAADALDSWRRILHREPRALEWVGIRERFGHDALQGFDFSPSSAFRRKGLLGKENVHTFSIERADDLIVFRLGDSEVALDRPETLLNDHLILKCAMNISSTLAMGRLGRFRGNLMLYVRAANNKLIDRSIRFVRILLAESKISRAFTYDEVCYALFEVLETLPPDQPVVIKTFDKLMASAAGEVRRVSNV